MGVKRKAFSELWKSKEPCPCAHEVHVPGHCTKCNCGESERIVPHGHPLWHKYGIAARHVGPMKTGYSR